MKGIHRGVLVAALSAGPGVGTALAEVPDAVRAIDAGDCKRAGEEINKGLDRNDAQAYFLAGLLLETSGCMRTDAAKAARYYQKAAELGDPSAPDFLGALYGTGRGVPQDYAAAYRWFSKPRPNEASVTPLDGEQARIAGYAYTVAHLARTKIRYPRMPQRDGTEASLVAVFDAGNGHVTFEQVRANTVVGSNVPKPQPFVDEVSTAYAAAIVETPKPSGLQGSRLVFRTPWSFKLQRATLDDPSVVNSTIASGVATMGRTEIAGR